MNNNFTYYMPTKIVYGIDSINDIDNYINNRKALLITSEGFVRRGLVDKIKGKTESIVYVVSNIKSHPEFKDLELIYNEIKNIDFDLIVALGGGSVIDAAKLLSVYNDKKDFSFVKDIAKGKVTNDKITVIPRISIPTTAGTGSEITPWATLWDMEEKKKYSLHLPGLFGEIALYDPSLTLSVPKKITVQTGLDTLSHSLESIWNKNASPITIKYAIESAKLIMEYLPLLVNDLNNLKYRDKIMEACMYSGLAFSNTQTAIAHAMSYYITAHKNIDHGIACSFTLPMLIDKVIGKYDFIDKALTDIFGELLSKNIRLLFEKLSVSTIFSDYDIQESEFLQLKETLKENQRANNSLVVI